MNELNRKLNAQAEMEASGEALAAAQALLAGGLLRSAVSRLYYAVFHLVRALLVSQGLDPRAHEGVETLFGLHFVRAGILDRRFGRLFVHVQKFRVFRPRSFETNRLGNERVPPWVSQAAGWAAA